ncbi:PDR/VanB family oxidoreductase [Nocardioides yefusunii]|uniref:PDR/VanB family oxidoreductase n=1 Tax=Nocardioides yefusunii TaxID=2500546 RepID=A0ABW1QZ89_9ACTN|nr:PDR/VanB family oxidoreductase [Nocardioides yefusunii]
MVFGIFKRKQAPVVTTVTAYDPVADALAKAAAAKASAVADDSYEVRVAKVTQEAEGVISITVIDPAGHDLPEWKAGAHLEIRTPSGLVRQYSLCSSPSNTLEYRVSVLREENGRGGSKELHDTDLKNKQLIVVGPRNHFPLEKHDKYVFIAGGIGVTPIRAMVEELVTEQPDAEFTVVYGGRSLATMAFREELVELAGDKLTVVPQDTDGLIDLKAALAGADAGTGVYCCGPSPLINAVEAAVAEHAPEADLHFERFEASAEATAERAAKALTDVPFELELRRTGVTTQVAAGQTVLDAILKEKGDFDFSCEEGHCGSCFATILEGKVDHRDEVLNEDEKANGDQMYVCVSRAAEGCDKIVLDV